MYLADNYNPKGCDVRVIVERNFTVVASSISCLATDLRYNWIPPAGTAHCAENAPAHSRISKDPLIAVFASCRDNADFTWQLEIPDHWRDGAPTASLRDFIVLPSIHGRSSTDTDIQHFVDVCL